MNAAVLRSFFDNTATIADLVDDLDGTRERLGANSSRHNMHDLHEDFSVTTTHLVKLCDAVLAGRLSPDQLEVIAFGMIASDHFDWDAATPDGERVADTLYDWSAPQVNYSLTTDTVTKFRQRLMTGENTFNKTDLYDGRPPTTSRVIWDPQRSS